MRGKSPRVKSTRLQVKSQSTETTSSGSLFSSSHDSEESQSWGCSRDTYGSTTTCSDSDLSFEESRSCLEESKEEKALKKLHNEASRDLNDGKLIKAEATFTEILDKMLALYGDEDSRIGNCLHNLGIAHVRSGKLNNAFGAIKEAIRIREITLGAFHPKVSDSMVELGIVLNFQEKYNDSIKMLRKALDIKKRELSKVKKCGQDEKHMKKQIAKIINKIGCSYFEWGDSRQAKDAFGVALEVQKEVVDAKGHEPSVHEMLTLAAILSNLGQTHLENSDWTNAFYDFKTALKIQESILNEPVGLDYLMLLATRELLAFAAINNGTYPLAKQIYQKNLKIYRKMDDHDTIQEIEIMKNTVFVHIKMHEYDDAIQLLHNILEIHPTWKLGHNADLEALADALLHHVDRSTSIMDTMCCRPDKPDIKDIHMQVVKPTRPSRGPKMSGHKVSFW